MFFKRGWLGTLQVVLQVGLDGLHLAGRQRITGQRRHGGADAAQLFYLFEQRNVGTGQAACLAGHGYLAFLDGDERLDAQHAAGHGHSGRQAAALAQVLQVVDGGNQMQVLLGVLQVGGDLHQRPTGGAQLHSQPYQQPFAQADVGAVHEQHVVHVDKVSGQSGALPGAGQLMGQEDAQHLVPGSGGVLIEPLEQLRAGLAGGGQLVTLL